MENKVIISNSRVVLNNQVIFESEIRENPVEFFKEIYKNLKLNYLKFFKMDHFSKLGFLASEILFRNQEEVNFKDCEIILACSSSSLNSDTQFQSTISNEQQYFPSPSVFVYTLPNIVIGEIAIRNKIYGNNCMYIISPEQKELFFDKESILFNNNNSEKILKGYLDFFNNVYYAEFLLTYK
jgi:hypothetical protein